MKELDDLIALIPNGVEFKYFFIPISWKGKFNESDYPDYVFNYSIYAPKNYGLLSQIEYKDEMLFCNIT